MKWHRWAVLALLWLGLGAYALVGRESNGMPPPFVHFDKVMHMALFFGQFALLAKAFLSANRALAWRALWVLALILAVASEVAQGCCTLTRTADFWDGVADMAGASVALYWAHLVQRARQNRAG